MLGWSIRLFRVSGIQLAIHFTFPLLLAYGAWSGWESYGDVRGMFWMVIYMCLLFTCVVLHELGHAFMARRFGIRVSRILLMPIGGMAEFDEIPRDPRKEVLIALAGPAVNFVLVWVLLLFVRFPSLEQVGEIDLTATNFAQHMVAMNLVMGCFNLIPAFPMDGGRVLRAWLSRRWPYLKATFAAATIGKIISVLFVIVFAFSGFYMGAALFAFIFFAGEIEYRSVKRLESESRQWKEWLAKMYPEPENTPPLL